MEEEPRRRDHRRPAPARERSSVAGTRLDIAAPELADRAPPSTAMSLVVANVDGTLLAYRERVRELWRRAARRGARSRARSPARRCGRSVLPAPGRPLDGRRPSPAPAGPAAARGRGDQGGAVKPLDEAVRQPPPRADGVRAARRWRSRSRRRRQRGRRTERCDLCGDDRARRPPPHARPRTSGRSSASARAAGRCGRATPSSGRPAAGRCGSRASSCPRSCGRSSGSRSGSRSSCTRRVTDCVVAMYPSPAGATESELHFETWSRLRRAEPGAARPRAGRRGADREPDGGSARVRDRPDRPLLHAGRA